jgi:hypothetical protein
MNRRSGIVCFVILGSLLICGSTAPPGCAPSGQIGPSSGEIIGGVIGVAAVIVVGTVVLVEVSDKSHHTIKGCVTAGPDGLTVHTDGNGKTYALTGVTANVKVGDVIKVHGSKQKGQKDSAGDQDFMVEKMSRDYGPCKADLGPQPATAQR